MVWKNKPRSAAARHNPLASRRARRLCQGCFCVARRDASASQNGCARATVLKRFQRRSKQTRSKKHTVATLDRLFLELSMEQSRRVTMRITTFFVSFVLSRSDLATTYSGPLAGNSKHREKKLLTDFNGNYTKT